MTAFNPPSSIYFNGIGFNPTIMEQGNTVSTGNVTLAGNNTFTGANSFTGSITVPTQTAGNNTTLAASTAFVTDAIASVSGVSLSGNNTFTGINTFTNGIITSNIEGNGTGIVIDNALLGTTFQGEVFINDSLKTTFIDTPTPDILNIGLNNATHIQIATGNTTTVEIGGNNTTIGTLNSTDIFSETLNASIYLTSPSLDYSTGVIIGASSPTVDLQGVVTAPTQTAGNNTTLIATTAFVTNAISSLLSGINTWSGTNNFTGSINVTTQTAGNNTTLAASTAFVTAAISALSSIYQTASQVTTSISSALTTFKTAANTWSGANSFTTGSINVTTQTAGNNTTLAASTAFVSTALTNYNTGLLSAGNTWTGINNFIAGTVAVATQATGSTTSTRAANCVYVNNAILDFGYQTASQVTTAITSYGYQTAAQVSAAVSGLLSTSNTWLNIQDFHLVDTYVKTQPAGTITDLAASTSFVGLAVTNGNSSIYSYITTGTNVWTGANNFTGGSINVTTQIAGNNTTLASSTAFVTAAITALKAAANTWSGSNDFTTGSINVTTQTAGNNTTLASSTGFVTAAITALKAATNTWTANQIFPTIQFSTGTLNQAFFIQYVNNYAFGAVGANASVTSTFSYATLGLTNYTTYITATISNSSSSANGSRVLFTIQAASATSFTIVGFNVTATATAACAFTIVAYGR
jgi:hypothetical protein